MSDQKYVMVPVEPTAEMIRAAGCAITTPDDLPLIGAGSWSMSDLAFRSRYLAAIAAAPQPAEQQPDDAAVDRFAAAMKAKLNKKRQEGRGGWQSMTAEQLSALLHEHVRKGDPVDVANLAMMLHQNGQRIEQQPAPDGADVIPRPVIDWAETGAQDYRDSWSTRINRHTVGLHSDEERARNHAWALEAYLGMHKIIAAHQKREGGDD